jgi:hypothetical protein
VLLGVAACGGSSSGGTPASQPTARPPRMSDDALIESMLARVGAAAGCPASKRVWCIAAEGWGHGAAPELPAGEQVLIGVSVALEREREDDELLATEVSLSALALRGPGDGRRGLITDIPPENPAETRVVRAAVSSVGRVLKGQDDRVELAPSLRRFADGLAAQASYPLSRAGGAWVMTGKSNARIRKVGSVWVALEVPRDGPEGVFLSLYPE